MSLVVCPHCDVHRFVPTKVPKEVIVVLSCPNCHELSVIYAKKIVPLNRKLLENGGLEDVKVHLAQVIGEFLKSGLLNMLQHSQSASPFELSHEEEGYAESEPGEAEEQSAPITQQELERFAKIDLKCIDDPAYFKKHFG